MNDFWKQKLAAFLHDPPSKCLDIRTHEERSDAAFRQAGFTDNEVGDFFHFADHTSAAADRLPFPGSQASGLSCAFDGIRSAFIHPLSSGRIKFHAEFKSAEQGIEGEGMIQPALSQKSLANLEDEAKQWRARFFAHWRLWQKHATEKDYRLSLLPADTRIPDHSIWTHMQVASALAGCINEKPNKSKEEARRPVFLKFQMGPVQDFIAAARSTRDLWSGSYLLSWLMAAGLKRLSEEVGPDAVIFPNLRGQPLFDLHWKNDLWDTVSINDRDSVWESLGWKNKDLLTPNLPNVFLALVPDKQAEELGQKVAQAIQDEWKRIADSVWKACDEKGLVADEPGITQAARKVRFDAQVASFLSLSWQATPWPNTLDDALKLADAFAKVMPIHRARERVLAVKKMAEEDMPVDHRDSRCYSDKEKKTKLNNVGLGWSVILAFNSWQLDAVRQTRSFNAWTSGGWATGLFSNKDSLNGREEAVAGGREWKERASKAGDFWLGLFKHEDWLGAPTLIKRIWHKAYLAAPPWNLKTDSKGFPMPNTPGIAAHKPEMDCQTDESGENGSDESYYAILTLDGDEIGKWVSGEKMPTFEKQLAEGALEYFTRDSNPDGKGTLKERFAGFLKSQRPLSPSYHIQLSETLSNFALRCARTIVEDYDGRLIYAGGDDVLAMLPADTALACAHALRAAFRGQEVRGNTNDILFNSDSGGFLASDKWKDYDGHPIPFLVPGPEADASVGIAIAHCKAPLQDVVRAAQAAEKRAKKAVAEKGLGRSAVAVTLFKHSGEIIEWGCKWEDGGLDLYQAIAEALLSGGLSSKFPHRVVELLDPYLTWKTQEPDCSFDKVVDEIIAREIGMVCDRQRGPNWTKEVINQIKPPLEKYLAELEKRHEGQQEKRSAKMTHSEHKLRAIIGLCQTVAFAHRTRPESVDKTTSTTAQ